jgi:hypothetical protein
MKVRCRLTTEGCIVSHSCHCSIADRFCAERWFEYAFGCVFTTVSEASSLIYDTILHELRWSSIEEYIEAVI